MLEQFENRYAQKKRLGHLRRTFLIVNYPHPADEFIPSQDVVNMLLMIQITDDERNHSRPSLRIRRKLSPVLATKYTHVASDFCIVTAQSGIPYLRCQFHCYDADTSKELYNIIVREFFK